jgi:hypothetical protein
LPLPELPQVFHPNLIKAIFVPSVPMRLSLSSYRKGWRALSQRRLSDQDCPKPLARIAADRGTQPGTSAERKPVEENDKTKPPNTSKSESNRKGADQAATSPNEVAPHDGLASSPAKRTGQRSAVDAKPKKAEKPRPGPEPERSKLVMMTLETIEFPDGHREQRLVPLKHSPRTAVQSDWYNPLGLR